MKRLFILVFLVAVCAVHCHAQEIYNEVQRMKDNYQSIKDNESLNIEERKIATFKYDAIWYLLTQSADETEQELGTQVAAMTDFVGLFIKKLQAAKGKTAQQTVMAQFKKASLENALFNDTDKELVYSYVDNDAFLTQFSLDTDWVKALEAVM